MPRVGFCINGFNGDQRDYFPFQFVGDPLQDPAHPETDFRPLSLPFDKAFEYIHRVRRLRATISISCIDKIDGETKRTDTGSQASRVMTAGPGEQGIQESFRHNYEWPDWLYDQPYPDFQGYAAFGLPSDVPLVYFAEESFSPYLQIEGAIEGGLDEGTIAQISTLKYDNNWHASSVTGTYMGEPFNLFEKVNEDFVEGGVSGYVTVEATLFWSYSGCWSISDGSQLIFPIPEGF